MVVVSHNVNYKITGMRKKIICSTLCYFLQLCLFTVFSSGCHAVATCVGNCQQTDGEIQGDVTVNDGEMEKNPDTHPQDITFEENLDVTEENDRSDRIEGCTPCEHIFPNCIEGATCCMDDSGREVCNGIDDDCDGAIDEDIDFLNDPRHCGSCHNSCFLPHAEVNCEEGECVFVRCLSYYHDCIPDDESDPSSAGCETYCAPSAEDDSICDRIDNDCDCEVDEDIELTSDIDNCGACGNRCRFPHATPECFSPDGTPENAYCRIKQCDEGYWNIDGVELNGCEYECIPCEYIEGECLPGHSCCSLDGSELCNSIDDDCDGLIDEDNPEGGEPCGTDTGECQSGIVTCIDGRLECIGEVPPAVEICDGLDNDCDGRIDEPDEGESFLPDENIPCGPSEGDCEQGVTRCVEGAVVCEGGIGPQPEVCDGHDNDCDGLVDESPIDGEGSPCGSNVGECRQGSMACQSGGWVCVGEVLPSPEICDGLDNDCNGVIDDPFNFMDDPENCGGCGIRCADLVGPHTIFVCSGGTCSVIGCESGWWDRDSNPNDCEYRCDYSGNEICDGLDNDCDTLTDTADPSLAIPPNFCPQTGACAGSSPICTTHNGITKWYCNYGADVNLDSDYETILPENDCDDIDNDCDGATDEAFPLKGTACYAGTGLCRNEGQYVCNSSQDGVICTATPGTPQPESCNGIDDNCDGIVDNFAENDWSVIGAVATPGSGAQYVFQYEASRPDATSCDGGSQSGTGGSITTKPCSKPGVQPWTDVDWITASQACCNLNDDGMCHYDGGGNPERWHLCLATTWEEICESQGNDYSYPYGDTYQPDWCNGNDYDTDCPCPGPSCPSTTGDQDEIMPTGSMLQCCSDWFGDCVYDMSGNVKEWTLTERRTGYREIRGGSNNVPSPGLTCQFDFSLAEEDFTFYNLGFRCCYY